MRLDWVISISKESHLDLNRKKNSLLFFIFLIAKSGKKIYPFGLYISEVSYIGNSKLEGFLSLFILIKLLNR